MIRVQQVSHADAHVAIHEVRQRVFVQEQGIAAELERDALDPVSAHVLALDDSGQPVGTGRLAPDGRIGRMAVLASHRSGGVGEALLEALVEAGRRLGLAELHLHAQLPARDFYARQGFLPEGEVFEEAGIDKPPATWDEMVTVGKKLSKDGKWALGAEGSNLSNNIHQVFVLGQQHGADFFDAEGKPDFTSVAHSVEGDSTGYQLVPHGLPMRNVKWCGLLDALDLYEALPDIAGTASAAIQTGATRSGFLAPPDERARRALAEAHGLRWLSIEAGVKILEQAREAAADAPPDDNKEEENA